MYDIAYENIPRTKFQKHLQPYWVNKLSIISKQRKAKLTHWLNAGKPRQPGNIVWDENKQAKSHSTRNKDRQYVIMSVS